MGLSRRSRSSRGVTYSVSEIHEISSSNAATYATTIGADYDPDDANSIQGGQYADSLQGGALNDTIEAGAGGDTIAGGAGDDQIATGAGADTLIYGDGDGTDSVSDLDMSDDGAGQTVD